MKPSKTLFGGKSSSSWNGKGIFLESKWTRAHSLHLYTNASSKIGYGAYWNGAWFSHVWSDHLRGKSIDWKELYAIVTACDVWGEKWCTKHILFHCDNQVIVQVWESGLSHSKDLMNLVCTLFFLAARHNFHILICHITGIDNSIADALSGM